MGADADRGAYVKRQLETAAHALADNDLAGACLALRALRSFDFERREVAEAHLGVLRDLRTEPAERLVAARKLTDLVPAATPVTAPSIGAASARGRPS